MNGAIRSLSLSLILILFFFASGCSSGEKVWVSCTDKKCAWCRGTGSYQCEKCGSGEWAGKLQCARCARGTARDIHGAAIVCTTCGGSGKIACDKCEGTGQIKHGEWVTR